MVMVLTSTLRVSKRGQIHIFNIIKDKIAMVYRFITILIVPTSKVPFTTFHCMQCMNNQSASAHQIYSRCRVLTLIDIRRLWIIA